MNEHEPSHPLHRPSDEGYVKYCCHHTENPAPGHPMLEALDALRTELFDAGLVGQRADGVGFGNLSVRDLSGRAHGANAAEEAASFVITATSTGGTRELGADGYCLVTTCDVDANTVCSTGPLQASSEAMSHAAVYSATPSVQCVVHIHSRELFDRLLKEGAPTTPSDAAFGTPAMARAVSDLARLRPLEGVIVMSGHDEGVIIYGPSVESVSSLLCFLQQNYSESRACKGGCCGS